METLDRILVIIGCVVVGVLAAALGLWQASVFIRGLTCSGHHTEDERQGTP